MKSLKTTNEVLEKELSLHRNNLKLTKSGVAKDPFTHSTVYDKSNRQRSHVRNKTPLLQAKSNKPPRLEISVTYEKVSLPFEQVLLYKW